jgi:hypothetical protein
VVTIEHIGTPDEPRHHLSVLDAGSIVGAASNRDKLTVFPKVAPSLVGICKNNNRRSFSRLHDAEITIENGHGSPFL